MTPNRRLALALTLLLSAIGRDARAADWNPAANLVFGRALHTATLLPSGKVLVAGGLGGFGAIPNAELYNPGTNSWSDGGFLKATRREHAATLLPGSGGLRGGLLWIMAEQLAARRAGCAGAGGAVPIHVIHL